MTFLKSETVPKAMYPYTYGDNLPQDEANRRLLKHGLAVGSACIFLILQVSHANAQEPIDSGLVGSIIDKSPLKEGRNIPYSPFISFHAPQGPTAKKVNTVLFIASTGVICANAYWTQSPALIVACLSITSSAMETALRGANPAL
jgi:hypothetical protein